MESVTGIKDNLGLGFYLEVLAIMFISDDDFLFIR